MKKVMIATAALAVMATSAFAADFEANEFVVTAQSGALELSLGTVDGKLDSVATTGTFANYKLGRFETSVDASLTYGRLSDTLGLEVEYNMSTALNDKVGVYGSAAVAYVAPTADLGAGDVFVAPTLGATYAVSETFGAFADVTYGWNASNDWTGTGGAVEVGVNYDVAQNVTLTPSLVRTFDTGADATNLKLEVGLSF
jgi:opacity protein-like surface antigen